MAGGRNRAVEKFDQGRRRLCCLSPFCRRRHGAPRVRFGGFASLAPNDQPEDALALGTFVFQHLVPVPDRRNVGQLPFDVACDANGFSVHGS
jgi:hypothetical protein